GATGAMCEAGAGIRDYTVTGVQTCALPSSAGTDAYTTTTANFTQPAVSSTVSVSVGATGWMAVGQYLYVNTGGYYTVSSITNGKIGRASCRERLGNAVLAATVISTKAARPR